MTAFYSWRTVISLAVAVLAAIISRTSLAQDAVIKPSQLRCEYRVDPLGIDVARPRLSWILTARDQDARGLSQRAYQLVVAKTPEGLATQRATLWDSGRVESSRTNQIEYGGAALSSRQQVYWKVRVWDQDGGVSDWSEPASWSMGLLKPEDWGDARWIGDATPPPASGFDPLPAPLLRKAFELGAEKPAICRATAYVTALGLYAVWINGQSVGDQVLAPEWTDYHQRIQYQTYDVTGLLQPGANAIGVALADGWYAGKVGLAGVVPNGPPRAIYGRQPRLLLRLELERADGSIESIVSDESWQSTLEGPIRTADLLDGVTVDARREVQNWSSPELKSCDWPAAKIFDAPKARLVAQPNEPIRVTRELTPIAVTEPQPDVFVFDLGQNMVGWCRLKTRGPAGTTVTLRHAEVLNPDGTLYTANLRGAAQTDRYTLRGEGSEVYEPLFTYHGFRYVEVTGLSEKPALETLVGRVLHSAASEVGRFECSEPLLNKLWQNILWTQRANMHSTPTDCPQRDERCGWMGDILAFAPTACFNMDMSAFFTKWIPDTRDAQATDGRFADFSPQPYDPNARFSGVPAWGDAGVFVPWVAYVYYGDQRMLAEQFGAAVRWVEYIRSNNPDLLWKNGRGNDYGDWLNADTLKLEGWPTQGAEMPKEAFATAFFARSTQLVAEMARVLGRKAESDKYAKLAEDIRAAFNRAYVHPDGRMEGDTQAGYAIALHFGLLPEAVQAAAARRMVDRFQKYHGQISTGFHSTVPLMLELSQRGYNADAYRLALNRKMPSWGYAIEHGATTIWERWDGYVEGRGFQDPGMNSFAHYAIGSVGEWMYKVVLGINPDPQAPGFEHVIIRPRPGPGLSWARGSYDSIRGRIASGWKLSDGKLELSLELPPNVRATVFMPATNAETVRESGQPAANARGVEFVRMEAGAAVYRLGSGRYVFEAPQP